MWAMFFEKYGCIRYIRNGQETHDAGCPTKGIPAGCVASTFHVQSCLAVGAQKWKEENPELGLNIHIDDVTMFGSHPKMENLIQNLAAGMRTMKATIEDRWQCQLA